LKELGLLHFGEALLQHHVLVEQFSTSLAPDSLVRLIVDRGVVRRPARGAARIRGCVDAFGAGGTSTFLGWSLFGGHKCGCVFA
jgi:hypothetical protein